MTGYVRQALANIQPNLNINSGDLNAEFNALQTAFDSVSGHTHDGTLGSGARVGRILLTNDTTFYVSASAGNDSNTGLTVGSPWKTIQHAWDTLAMNYDLAGHQATIQLAAGTYITGLLAAGQLTGQINSSTDPTSGNVNLGSGVLIQGDITTPSNVYVQVSGAHCFQIDFGAIVRLAGMKVSSTGTGGGYGVTTASFSYVGLSNMEYGACDSAHIHIGGGRAVEHNNNKITGAAPNHYSLSHSGSQLINLSVSYAITGTLNFSTAFISCFDLASWNGTTAYTGGTVTGTRYVVTGNAVVDTAGAGASYFPGDGAGSTATGGQYI